MRALVAKTFNFADKVWMAYLRNMLTIWYVQHLSLQLHLISGTNYCSDHTSNEGDDACFLPPTEYSEKIVDDDEDELDG